MPDNFVVVTRQAMIFIACFFSLSLTFNPQAFGESLFKSGEHCVAYKARKTLGLIHTVDIIGKNCEVSAQFLPDLNDEYYLEVYVPLSAFESGETERDRDVLKVLRADKSADLVFKSEKYAKEKWIETLKQNQFVLPGELSIGNSPHAVKLQVNKGKTKTDVEMQGFVSTSFKQLGLKPPELAFGLAAKVREELELHFSVQSSKVLGANSLLK